ncbi:MAG: nicotinate phosphoribosyltransferase [Bacteroidota bacterium]
MHEALLTDLYQLTMSYGYWKAGMHQHETVFHLFFRKHPFKGGYTIAAGLAQVIEYLKNFRFTDADIAYLADLTGNDGAPLFEAGFLQYLKTLKVEGEIWGVPEGTIVFPHEPLLRIQGSIVLCQLLETPLLNMLNFQTLIATKAARVCQAAAGDPVLEFGLRRAQGVNGGLSASRAAYLGGCTGTSNVLAGKQFGIPVKGTHAHSWVMSFPSEAEAFETYAAAMPNNCIFLVDTYDTLEGVKRATKIGKELSQKGHRMVGVRLDSGDLVELSKGARKLLDEAGFTEASVVASNDLDEYEITRLKTAGAKIDLWGVGTRLATAYEQAALGGVYILAAIRHDRDTPWSYRIKLSEQAIKVSNPGRQQVWRYYKGGKMVTDMIWHEAAAPGPEEIFETFQGELVYTERMRGEPLLVPLLQGLEWVYNIPSIEKSRQRTLDQLAQLPEKYAQLERPEIYPTGLSGSLKSLKEKLIRQFSS